jgi:membrane associated rhomboid family serine protease
LFSGTAVVQLVGVAEFLALYLGSAVVAGLVQRYQNPKAFTLGASGIAHFLWLLAPFKSHNFAFGDFSGAVYSLLSTFAFTFPTRPMYMLFIPMPSIAAIGLLMALDLYQMGGRSGVGHGAHLTGALCGIAFWAARVRGRYYGIGW